MSISAQNPEDQPAESGTTSSSSPTEEQVKPQITEKQAARINAPARNMVISMVVMVAMLVPILLLVPQLTSNQNHYDPKVDVASIAYQAGNEAGYPVLSPAPDHWTYNFARWRSGQADGVDFWNAGVVSPNQQYVELKQAKDTNPTWVAQQTQNGLVTDNKEIDGVNWEIRTYTDKDEKTTTYYVGEIEQTTVILSADDATDASTIEDFARAVISYQQNPTHTVEPTPTDTSGIK